MPKIKTVHGIENRKVVSQKKWLVARKKLLKEEKTFTKLRDKLILQRRKLPWVKIEKEYVFDGPTGRVTLGDLFCGKSQLIIYHFMFGPGWKEGCEHCSFWADHFDSVNIHIGQRDTTFAVISRAPLAEIEPFKKRMGWQFKWLSSFNTDFNFDFNVSFTPEQVKSGLLPGWSCSTPRRNSRGAATSWRGRGGNCRGSESRNSIDSRRRKEKRPSLISSGDARSSWFTILCSGPITQRGVRTA